LSLEAAKAALDLFEVDPAGLDRLDRSVLEALCNRFAGGPVGLTTLAVSVGEEPETVETVSEPYLVREGFIARTPRGRIATPNAFAHLGLTPPRAGSEASLFDFGDSESGGDWSQNRSKPGAKDETDVL
ncbi:MAG: Holliday junction DNA helicase RuvB C-terminal domain-containing protein, partial [Varibaculum cambriense]|nr:Holliday junction DNA helicase RuvB C-terminal domain-containing protein [Varibaculum cambriense]